MHSHTNAHSHLHSTQLHTCTLHTNTYACTHTLTCTVTHMLTLTRIHSHMGSTKPGRCSPLGPPAAEVMLQPRVLVLRQVSPASLVAPAVLHPQPLGLSTDKAEPRCSDLCPSFCGPLRPVWTHIFPVAVVTRRRALLAQAPSTSGAAAEGQATGRSLRSGVWLLDRIHRE